MKNTLSNFIKENNTPAKTVFEFLNEFQLSLGDAMLVAGETSKRILVTQHNPHLEETVKKLTYSKPTVIRYTVEVDESHDILSIYVPVIGHETVLGVILNVAEKGEDTSQMVAITIYVDGRIIGDTKIHNYAGFENMTFEDIGAYFAHGVRRNHHNRVIRELNKIITDDGECIYMYPAQGPLSSEFDIYALSYEPLETEADVETETDVDVEIETDTEEALDVETVMIEYLKVFESFSENTTEHNVQTQNMMVKMNNVINQLVQNDAMVNSNMGKIINKLDTLLFRQDMMMNQQPQQPYRPGHQPQQGYHYPQTAPYPQHPQQQAQYLPGYGQQQPQQPQFPWGHSPHVRQHFTQESRYGSSRYPVFESDEKIMSEKIADIYSNLRGIVGRMDCLEEAIENPKPSEELESDIYQLIRDIRHTVPTQTSDAHEEPIVGNSHPVLLEMILNRIKETNNGLVVEFDNAEQAIDYMVGALSRNTRLSSENEELRSLFNDAANRIGSVTKDIRGMKNGQ